MLCDWVRGKLERYVEVALGPLESFVLRWHVSRCDDCYEAYDRCEATGGLLAPILPLQPPPRLKLRTLSALSRVRQASRPRAALTAARLAFSNIVRPAIVPVVGGLSIALVVLPLMVLAFWVEPVVHAQDVPLLFLASPVWSAPAIAAPSPFPIAEDIAVVAFIDARGAVYDYLVAGAQAIDARGRSQLANALLTSKFRPAMRFGRPVAGSTVILFQRIDSGT